MTKVPPTVPIVHCAECGAENMLPAARCWLCYKPLPMGAGMVVAEVVPERTTTRKSPISQWVFGIMTGAVVLLVVLIGMGIAIDQPPQAIVYLVIVLPGLVATGVSMRKSLVASGQVSWQRSFSTLILSFSITMAVLVVLVVAAFVAFFLYCLSEIARH